ncbi:MAG: VOC family protein [Candidatus Acidiferrum sp.]|jgi:catechol 2,3-dioxygenase-like lactoylglutathione lyase family enzyme
MTQPKNAHPANAAAIDMKLEVVVIPVSDVERAKAFYQRLGWRLDPTPSGVAQFTPPGSGCSVQFGGNRTTAAPGSAQGLWLIVSDLQATLHRFAAVGIEVDEVYHLSANGKATGLDPERHSYRSLAAFRDPDGNRWVLQEVTTRLPGRIDPAATSFGSVTDLENALRRAAAAHGEHEKRTGAADANWPAWYAKYLVAEQAGTGLPT